MFSCCCHAHAAGGLFSRFAGYYRHRYRWFGLESSQRQLVKGLERFGYEGASLLEVGCGVGYLHQTLLRHGAVRAVGVDLSTQMLEEARALARDQGLEDRLDYRLGDFVQLAGTLEPSDIVIMDKVICCYPDYEQLLSAASSRANRLVALTYPRVHWLTRLAMGSLNLILSLAGSDFRTYLHDPGAIGHYLASQGWKKAYETTTLMWLTQVYCLKNAPT